MSERLIDECRKAFEGWAAGYGYFLDIHEGSGNYEAADTHSAWQGWQAAWKLQDARVRAALV